jgi:hypothetical protein
LPAETQDPELHCLISSPKTIFCGSSGISQQPQRISSTFESMNTNGVVDMNNLQNAKVSRFHADPKKSQEHCFLGDYCIDSRNRVVVMDARLAVFKKQTQIIAGAKMATLWLDNVLCHSGDGHTQNELVRSKLRLQGSGNHEILRIV